MITKAIITSIPYPGTNLYKVRVPIFEQAGINQSNVNSSEFDAMLCYQPGNLNSYKVDDVVFISFENNMYSNVVILGKLYLGNEEEATNYSYNNTLEVKGKAELPINTTIGGVPISELSPSSTKVNHIEEKSNTVPTFILNGTTLTIKDNSINKFVGGYTRLQYIETTGEQSLGQISDAPTSSVVVDANILFTYLPQSSFDLSTNTIIIGQFIPSFDVGALTPLNISSLNSGPYVPKVSIELPIRDERQWPPTNTKESSVPLSLITDTPYHFYSNISTTSQEIKVDGTTGYSGTDSMSFDSTSHSLYLFPPTMIAFGENKSVKGLRVYDLKLYIDGNLTRDFIPAKRDEDGAIGLYDKVSDTFFTNSTGESLISGGVIESVNITDIVYEKDI